MRLRRRIRCSANWSFPAKAMYRCCSPRTKQTTKRPFPCKKHLEFLHVKDGINKDAALRRIGCLAQRLGMLRSIHLLIRREQLPDLL